MDPSIKPDSIVWVKLGALYGWWPAIFQPTNFLPDKKVYPDLEILESTKHISLTESEKAALPFASSSNADKPVCGFARFFDDDKFDLYYVRDPKDIKPYSCPDKLSTIRNGMKKFEPKKETKKRKGGRGGKKSKKGKDEDDATAKEEEKEQKKDGLFDLRARLAQFYKDVELAEVMTDNSPKVGEILQLYEIEGEEWGQVDGKDLDVDDNDEEEDEENGGVVTADDENSPTENLNPNTGSAPGSKKRKLSPTLPGSKKGKAKKQKS